MGYDTNSGDLSPEELGAYMIAQSLAGHTRAGMGGFKSQLSPEFQPTSEELAQKLGQQVFGDNHPKESSVDTSTSESMQPVMNDAPKMRC